MQKCALSGRTLAAVPSLERAEALHEDRLGVDLDRSLPHVLDEIREAVQPMRRDAVAAGVGEQPRAEFGAVAPVSALEQDAQEFVEHVLTGNARYDGHVSIPPFSSPGGQTILNNHPPPRTR